MNLGSVSGVEPVPTSPPPTPPTPTVLQSSFSCQLNQGQYTVMYHPRSQPGQVYPWALPGEMGGGWSPQRRCEEISRRLEFYRPDGLIALEIGRENGYDILCVTTEKIPTCRIVLTVPIGQDPSQIRDRVFQNLTVADSGQNTQGVNTFREPSLQFGLDQLWRNPPLNFPVPSVHSRSNPLDLRPFLDPLDGGTGLRLRR